MDPKTSLPVQNNVEKHRFEVHVGDDVAVAEYGVKEQVITFTHTKVPDALKGQGVGASLAKAGLDYARQQNFRAVPQCPFFARYIQRHPEYADLISGAVS